PLFDSGEADGVLFYVMPYVQGESLREKLDRDKQLSVDDAVRIAKAVAGALDHAHRQGVIHRDIKPANILLQDGQPMVADFGIALAVSAAGGGRLTETGLSLGTPYYMSPEQATADRDPGPQSDVYSLACVLYEMIAGDPPHTGSSAQAVLARILTDRPRPLTELRETVPPHVAASVTRGLAKVPADRFESAAAFARALDDVGYTYAPTAATTVIGVPAGGATSRPVARTGGRAAWGVASVALVAAAWGWLRPAPQAPEPPTVRVSEVLGVSSVGGGRRIAVSPDGRWLAYAGGGGSAAGVAQLFVRASDQATWQAMAGTEGGLQPDFSPRGDWIVFSTGASLSKIPVGGGPVLTLTRSGGDNPRWGRDGFVYFTSVGGDGVLRVSEAGGEPETLALDPRARYAVPLPDGSGVLYTRFQGLEDTEIMFIDLETREVTSLGLEGAHAQYVPTGHLIYGHGSQTLMAVPFDLKTHQVTGAPAPVLPNVAVFTGGATQFAVSDVGTVAYTGADASSLPSRLVLFDLGGGVEELPVSAVASRPTPRFSPDGRRIAFDDGGEIHVFDMELGTNAPVTHASGDYYAVWEPDGTALVYRSAGGLGRVPVDGSAPPELMHRDSAGVDMFPHAWSPDGETLVWRRLQGDQDLLLLEEASGATRPYLQGDWNEQAAALSPDGRWLAYDSDESGQNEVYVRAFPEPGARYQVSVGGGSQPVWSPDGRTLYYRTAAELVAASLSTGGSVQVTGRDTVLRGLEGVNDIPWAASYDVHPDGKRFVFFMGGEVNVAGATTNNTPLTVVTNWFAELRGRLGNED
ncbi:MAG TPA: protein kinase, partial [Longimicrobiales bacterium]|nr:protein kinase [Longimicrobiales bacterium]